MALLGRLSTLLRADAHGMIDALEDRALLLRQSLREAEAELGRKRARLEVLDTELADLDADRRRLEEERESLDADVDLALDEERPELARFATRRLLAVRRALGAITSRTEAARRDRESLSATLSEQEERFAELERRTRARLAAGEGGRSDPASPPTWAVTDEEVELELLERRRTAAGGTS